MEILFTILWLLFYIWIVYKFAKYIQKIEIEEHKKYIKEIWDMKYRDLLYNNWKKSNEWNKRYRQDLINNLK